MEINKIKILAIDDNPDNLISIKALIFETFPNAITMIATNGPQGIELAIDEDPDVILLDIVMPGMDGFEVCEKLKAHHKLKEIPVVFITALKGDKASLIKVLDLGAEAFITRPIDELELYLQIRAMVKIKKANIEELKKQEQLILLVEEKTEELKKSHAATINLLEDLKKEIEQRKFVEQEMREIEENLKRGEQVAKCGHWKLCLDNNMVFLSEGAKRIYGTDKIEITLDELKQFRLPEYNSMLDEVIGKAIHEKIPYDVEYKIKRQSDGKIIDVQSISEFDPKSGIVFGVLKDITECKQNEKALEESEYFFKESQKSGFIGSYKTDFTSGNWKSSEVLDQIFGIDQNYKRNIESWFEIIHPDDREMVNNYLMNKVIPKQIPFNKEYRIIRKADAQIRWVLGLGKADYDSNGNILSMTGTTQDITDRKLAEGESAKLFLEKELILSSIAEGVLGLDLQGNHTFINEAGAKMLGYKPKELIGHPSHSTWHHTKTDGSFYPAEECPIYATIKDGKVHSEKSELFWRKDGTSFFAEFMSNPIFEQGQLKGAVVTFKDITDRRHKETELKKLQTAVNHSGDVIFLTDSQGIFTSVNPAFTSIYGYTADEVIGKTTPRVLKSEQYPAEMYKNFWDNLLSGKEARNEYKNKRKDGTLVDIEGASSTIFGSDGNISGFLGVQRDITSRKMAEEALKESKKRYIDLFNKSNEGIIIMTLDGIISEMNHSFADMHGYTIEQLNNFDIRNLDVLKENTIKDRAEIIYRATKGELVHFEVEHFHKEGHVFPLSVSVSIIELNGKQFLLCSHQDITDRKNAEKEIILAKSKVEESDRLNKTLLQTIPFGMHIVDEKGNILFWNTNFKKQFSGNNVGKKCWEIYRDDKLQCPGCQLLDGVNIGETKTSEIKDVLGGRVFEVTQTGMVYNGQIASLEIFIDVTERKQVEEEIVSKNKELETFISVTSHDLRSPLLNIQGFSQYFKEHTESIRSIVADSQLETTTKARITDITDNEIPQTLNYVLSSVTKMDMLIKGISQISRTGQQVMTVKKIDMNQLFKTILDSFKFQLNQFSAKVIVEELPSCFGDQDLLNQLFSNLIGNAIKYRDHNRQLTITISAEIRNWDKITFTILA